MTIYDRRDNPVEITGVNVGDDVGIEGALTTVNILEGDSGFESRIEWLHSSLGGNDIIRQITYTYTQQRINSGNPPKNAQVVADELHFPLTVPVAIGYQQAERDLSQEA